MITSVKETIVGTKDHGSEDQFVFWTYMICHVSSGRGSRYNLIRVDDRCERMERLGCEITLEDCRELIAKHEEK